MKAVWVDHGQDADPNLLRKHEIDRPYFDGRDTRVTAAYLDNLKSQGFLPGLYFAWNWWPKLDGTGFAHQVDSEVKRIGWRGNPDVCLDMETHDETYIVSALEEWRKLRPTRRTDWTLEGMQGGWVQNIAHAVIAANVRVAPQFFVGAMQPHPHSPIIDLLMAGIPGDRLVGFYDAASLPYRWNGYCLSQGRLPA